MHFDSNEVYHVYNRGNNKQPIFFNEKNYLFFLNKIRNEWKKYCEILSYCLMPNHFHFMLYPNEHGCKNIILDEKITHLQNLSKTIGHTLSSYTKAINIQNHTIGTLFQKKTKAKCLTTSEDLKDISMKEYLSTCFYYVYRNPLTAIYVTNIKDWPYSSFPDYYGYRNGSICNKNLALDLLSLSNYDFKNEEVVSLNNKIISKLF